LRSIRSEISRSSPLTGSLWFSEIYASINRFSKTFPEAFQFLLKFEILLFSYLISKKQRDAEVPHRRLFTVRHVKYRYNNKLT
jgi:hypothetical protein